MLLVLVSSAALLVPAYRLAAGVVRMSVFPANDEPAGVPSAFQGRGRRLADLLAALAPVSDEERTALLEAATPLLLEPFEMDIQEPDSIFEDFMTLQEKRAVYRATLSQRISAAKSEALADALRAMRDHTLDATGGIG